MSADHPNGPARIASREEWLAARIALLEKEKALTAMKDALAAERRALPWVRGCALEVDHLAGIRVHLEHHDVAYAVVARAPIDEIERLKRKMGWDFTWVSSYRSDFNFDFNVSFSDAGEIFHTYSTYGRGGEQFLGIYGYLDVTPKGRAEYGPYHSLPDWVRPRNMYGHGGTVTAWAGTTPRIAAARLMLKCSNRAEEL